MLQAPVPPSDTPQINTTPVPDSDVPVIVTTVAAPVIATTVAAPVIATSITAPDVPVIATTPIESYAPTTAGPDGPALATSPPDAPPPPAGDAPDDDMSDSMSYTSTIPDYFEVGSDDTAPPATGPWMIIDHFTGEMICDDNQSTPPTAAVPTTPITHAGPGLAGVETAITRLGDTYLIETPPTLLSEDEEVRPQWLMTAVNSFLRLTPYFGGLGKVVDLYLAQEARLGYPQLVCTLVLFLVSCSEVIQSTRLPLPSSNRPTEVAAFMKWGRKYNRGDKVDAEKFGQAVLQWWLTIQPTTRKNWPPVYDTLPEDFSFDYFNHGGPNGTFLMLLCLCWWANSLAPGMDFTNFNLVVGDVHWVLEQIANRA